MSYPLITEWKKHEMHQGEWFYDHIVSKNLHEEFYKQFKLYMADSKKKSYRYMMTFTQDPEKTKDLSEDDIQVYIEKQMKRAPLKIKEAHICKEYHKNGTAHWHLAVESYQCIKKDRFNYYIKKIGFLDISKTKAQNLEEALNYMSKDSETKKIV